MNHDSAARKEQTYRSREAVGVFPDSGALERAVNELETAGFDPAAISVLGSDREVRRRIGLYRSVAEIEDDARAPRAPFVSGYKRAVDETNAVAFPLYIGGIAGLAAVVASGGALALAIAAAIIGSATGASLGGLLAGAIAEHNAKRIQAQIERGGLVLWVKVDDANAEQRALAALEKSGAQDVHTHEIRRRWAIDQ